MTGKRNQSSSSPIGSPSSGNISDSCSKEQDRFLPIANVSRIMKKSLPANAKISKEAKETVQECVSEFISFITGEASDKCQREKRKTINGDDLLWAMTTLGFENYVGPLKVYLNKYRETEGEKNSMARQEDQAPSTPAAVNEFNKVVNMNNNIAVKGITDHNNFQGYGSGFFSLGAQVTAHHQVQSYGDNHGGMSFNTSRIRENGDGSRTMAAAAAAAHLHRVDW
ncbi:Transcription factor, CBFA/NFYB, DNA topoisomerase [Corchorus capsularis]|uniref:Transcription factor, CBFA/NFYB, DNA topoisomerase n=1 Tax=Corchorus capsularis TaxID=210143 RepID=A0A1R3GD19_COCAP|nr:Transcription factor, CBFA/NFYB, DNA topoisomerase [Corchorus capsularis]